jgi:hypothetical protein
MKRSVLIAGTAALAAGLGFGAAAAYADPSPRPGSGSPSMSTDRPPAIGVPGVPGHALLGGPPPLDQMLYGEAVGKDENGAVKTRDWQNGVVTAVAGSSATVRSTDGTTWTWTLTGDTKVRKSDKAGAASDVKTGDKVAISGLRSGTTRTAEAVIDPPPDFTKIRERLRKHLPRLHGELRRVQPSPPA